MLRIVRGRFFHDNPGQFLIFRGVVIIVSPCAMTVQHTVHVGIQYFRIFFCQPCRRSCCRRTEDHFHPHLFCQIQKSIKEIIIKYSLVPLNLTPCKLCDSDHLDTVFQHSSQIIPPKALIPVFRVITGPQYQSFAIYNLHRVLLLYICILVTLTEFLSCSAMVFIQASLTPVPVPCCFSHPHLSQNLSVPPEESHGSRFPGL